MSRAPSVTWEILVSAFFHLAAFSVFFIAKCAEGPPPIKSEDVMMISMAGPIKQTTAMPQKAERAPPPAAGTPTPTSEPPPPRQSDMAIKTPDAPTQKGDPKADKLRDEMLAEMRRRSMLQDMEAPIGKVDRQASSPDGTADPSEASAGSGAPSNAELSKWAAAARRMINPNWHPILSICQANPSLATVIRVSVDGSGNFLAEPAVKTGSSNTSLDGSALRAVQTTGKLPPTPASHPNGWDADLRFSCKEAL